MLILKFRPTYPPFCETKFFLGLGNPVRESGTPAYLRSLKMLPINFSSQKTYRAKFLGHCDSQLRIYGHFKVFSKKIQRLISPFHFLAVPVSQKFYLLLQFSRYRDAVCAILLTTKLSINFNGRFLNFFLKNFFQPSKPKFFFF